MATLNKTIKTTKLFSGVYLVTGKEVQFEVNNDCGYWEVDAYSDTVKGLEKIDYYFHQYNTKKEAVYAVQCYDWDAIEKKQK
jgi:hypothetical protein